MHAMQWDPANIVQAIMTELRQRVEAHDLEQAVYSIDGLDELDLHPMIQHALRQAGYGVYPEERYPSERTARRKSTGKRCDIVLTPDDAPLADPHAEDTLFAAADAVPLEAAYWLEIKTVSQYTTEGPFARYSAELLSPVKADVRKLARDVMIFHAGLLLVLFTETRDVAEHDLQTWLMRCMQQGYPVAQAVAAYQPITERLGNGHMAVALFPIRRL